MESAPYLLNNGPDYIEALYRTYKQNPEEIDGSWKQFFEGFEFGISANGALGEELSSADREHLLKESKVQRLISAFRQRAHLLSDTNPIRQRKDRNPSISISDFELTEADLSTPFASGIQLGLPQQSTLQEILDKLHRIYTSTIGIEYMHIQDLEPRRWLMKTFESRAHNYNFSVEQSKRILGKLNEASTFEHFLHRKYVGQKRFSLEGGEALIPALDFMINKGSELGTKEVVIGMAHRGRLNVLANILKKTYEYIFSEFENIEDPDLTMGDGDVKYHKGFMSCIETPSGKEVYLKLVPNPSHLEAVGSVVEGYTRAKADMLYSEDLDQIIPILIHGDAAVAGQGIVYELAQMSMLPGYYTGGTIHFIINNQLGFTTDWDEGRSSTYTTGVAKAIDAPVFHVNGDDAEAVAFVSELAVEWRQRYNRDVYIDMVCYRKYGHNEGDEPQYTQPKLYELIDKHPSPREIYRDKLVEKGEIGKELAKNMEKDFRSMLQDRLNKVKQQPISYTIQRPEKEWGQL